MRIKRRKMHPEPPRWFHLDNDCCWWCKKNYLSCSGCGRMRKLMETKRSIERDKLRQTRDKRCSDD